MSALCPCVGCARPSHDGGVCSQHVWTLKRDLEKVPGLVDDLRATMARQTRHGPAAEKVDGRGESPVFYQQRAADERRRLAAELARWASVVFGDAAWTATAAAAWLLDALPDLRTRGDAGPLWSGVQAAVSRAEQAVDSPTMRTVIDVGPCPEDGCTGAVRAFIPADDAKPGHMACDGEPAHSWNSTQFFRAGMRIHALAARRAREQRSRASCG